MKSSAQINRPEPSEREIQKAAYFLWQERGRPAGRDVDTWLEAREALRHRVATALTTGPKSRPPRVRISAQS